MGIIKENDFMLENLYRHSFAIIYIERCKIFVRLVGNLWLTKNLPDENQRPVIKIIDRHQLKEWLVLRIIFMIVLHAD